MTKPKRPYQRRARLCAGCECTLRGRIFTVIPGQEDSPIKMFCCKKCIVKYYSR